MNLDQLSPEEKAAVLEMRATQAGEPAAEPGVEPAPGQRRWGEFPPPNPPTVTRVKDAAVIVDKQIGNLQAVGQQNYLKGIASPKKDPIQAGIEAQGAYEAKMRDPAVLKRREAGLRRTSMAEWALMAETIGAQNLVAGVVARRAKVERFWSAWMPLLTAHLQTIDRLPNVTDADRERRMVENLRGLRALHGRA